MKSLPKDVLALFDRNLIDNREFDEEYIEEKKIDEKEIEVEYIGEKEIDGIKRDELIETQGDGIVSKQELLINPDTAIDFIELWGKDKGDKFTFEKRYEKHWSSELQSFYAEHFDDYSEQRHSDFFEVIHPENIDKAVKGNAGWKKRALGRMKK